MWIKICANTNLADAQLAACLGADAVGFIFAPSKRRVTAAQAAAITRELPSSLEKVGVFSGTGALGRFDAEEIASVVNAAGLTAVQLHGAFDGPAIASLSARLGPSLKLIQTIAYEIDAANRRFEAALSQALTAPALWAVLIDAARSGTSGGLGLAFDWKRAAQILNRVIAANPSAATQKRVILAGGLRAENVAEGIAVLRPWGVDVASGVECEPGRKDPERLRRFIAAAV